MAHSPKGRIMEEITFGTKVDILEAESSRPADAFEASNACDPEPANLDQVKLQLDIKAEYQHSSIASMLEELPAAKCRLSPLAARAALASLVSTAYDDGAHGTQSDDHQMTKNLPIMDNCSLEDPHTLVSVARETVNLGKKSSLDENHGSMKPQLEKSTELNDASAKSRHSIERKSVGVAKTGRITRSSIQKANSSVMNAEDILRSSSVDSEDLVIQSGFKDEANVNLKEGEEDAIQITRSGNSKRSKPKRGAVTQNQGRVLTEMEVGMCTPAPEVGDQRSSFGVNNRPTEEKAKGRSVKRKLVELQVPGRVTRSALQKATENADIVVQVKSFEEAQERVSKKTRRSICSSGLEKAENLTESHGLHKGNFVRSAKSHNSKMNVSEERNIMAQKKETVSKQIASVGQTPATDSVKAKTSSSTKKAERTEGHTGKSGEQNKKSKQNKKSRRFSHRLRFLPRTRSQVKS